MATLEHVLHLLSRSPVALARAATLSRSLRNQVYRDYIQNVYHARRYHEAARKAQRRKSALNTAYRLGMNYGQFIHLIDPYTVQRLATNLGMSRAQLARLFVNIQRTYVQNQTLYNNTEFRRLVNRHRRH